MTTVVNNPGTTSDSDSSMGIMAIVILLVVALLFFAYGLPAIRRSAAPAPNTNNGGTTNVNLPDTKPDAQINIPDKVDVNINGGQPAK